jgi:[acyl-carrier-protein] S-malonyltransferase
MRAFLFPGQGTQKVGMGVFLREHFAELVEPLWQEADQLLGCELSRMCAEGPVDLLRQMPITQPAVFMCSYSAFVVARARGAHADVISGHSLGEYSALAAAGVLDWREVLQVVRYRGELMAQVQDRVDGKMAAVLGRTLAEIEDLCVSVAALTGLVLEVANHNEERQVVVSGQSAAVDLLICLLEEQPGTRATVLRIGGPAHSSLMGEASHAFAEHLRQFIFRGPQVELISGSTARAYISGEDVKRQLSAQLVHRVLWVDVMLEIARRGVTHTWELGPGRVLTGFVERAMPHAQAYRANDLPAFVDAAEKW